MYRNLLLYFVASLVVFSPAVGQVLLFGKCADVETMKYFDLERFMGQWHEISRYPTWYEERSACAHKRIQYCGRRVEIEHVYVKHGIQYVLHVNSTYAPGDDAVFAILENNIDPVGIPLTVIATDYDNYAVVYGCKDKEETDLKYITAWILSRNNSLSEEHLLTAYDELNSVPYASTAYLEQVDQGDAACKYHWTAHIQADYYEVSGE